MTETPTKDSDDIVKATHGFLVSSKTDEAERSVVVRKGENGQYHALILTKWAGESEEVKTELWLSPAGLELLTKAFYEASTNMEAYRINTCPVVA